MPDQETESSTTETGESSAKTSEGGPDAAASETQTVPAGGPATEDSASRTEFDKAGFDKLKAERDQLVERLARLQAEFENARKRNERERADFRDYATGNVVEQFLPVLDNFELALKATGSADQLRSGVELIVKQMDEVLRQMQVTAVPAVGEQFDPRYHEALGSVDREDLPDHQILEEIRRGYKLREKLLRPALVRVVNNPKQRIE